MIQACLKKNKTRIHAVAMAMALAVLGGCSILPEAETLQVYTLPEGQSRDVQQASAVAAAQPWSLKVHTPYSNRMLNSSRIVVRPDHSELSVYKGARWSDPAPVVLRNRLVNAFRSRANITAVSSDSTGIASDLELGSDLNRFQVEYLDGEPTVHIQLDAFVINTADSNILASQRFTVKQPVDGKEVPEVVLAFGQATDRLAVDIVAWVLKHSPNGVKGHQE